MKARYFCENCGAEVRAGASRCPSCGRVFTAVRCPECGFEGRTSEFANGCPSCGFMVEKEVEPADQGSARPPSVAQRRTASGRTAPLAARPRTARRHRPTLSARFYRVAGIILAALVVALVAILLVRG